MEISELAKALIHFQLERPEVKLDAKVRVKTKTGRTYEFEYATLKNILNQVIPVLLKHGLVLTQTFSGNSLVTTLMHSSGQYQVSEISVDLTSGSMQDIGSRISYIKRYSVSAMLLIIGEADDEGNIADGNEFSYEQKKKVPAPTPLPPERRPGYEPPQPPKTEPSRYQAYLQKMAAIKKEIITLNGNDVAYYDCLSTFEFKKSDEVKDIDKALEIYAAMKTYVKGKKVEKDNEIPY